MLKFIVSGLGQGITVVEGVPGESLSVHQCLDAVFLKQFDNGSTYALAKNGGEILFAPSHFANEGLYYLRPGNKPVAVPHIRKPGPKETHKEPIDWHGATHSQIGYLVTSTRYGLAWVIPNDSGDLVFNGWFKFDYDSVWHLNSVLIHNGFFILGFHRLSQKQRVPSEIGRFKPNLSDKRLTLIDQRTLGRDIHNLIVVPDFGILTCSSAEQKVLGVGCDFELEIAATDEIPKPYVRGLYYQDGILAVGKSDSSSRPMRSQSPCAIDFYDLKSKHLVDTFVLPETGSITEIVGFE